MGGTSLVQSPWTRSGLDGTDPTSALSEWNTTRVGGQCCFLQAEEGIRDYKVTGVQTCALPICGGEDLAIAQRRRWLRREAGAHSQSDHREEEGGAVRRRHARRTAAHGHAEDDAGHHPDQNDARL